MQIEKVLAEISTTVGNNGPISVKSVQIPLMSGINYGGCMRKKSATLGVLRPRAQ